MKGKRYKKLQKALTFYKSNFGLVPPYRILIDGTFCLAALHNQINLREQLPKYLCDKVELMTTDCVLNELVELGDPVYGALHIAQNFADKYRCPHSTTNPLSCFHQIARKEQRLKRIADDHHQHSSSRKKFRYFFATQDRTLSEKLRKLPGIPILYIRGQTIVLELPSEKSTENADAKIQQRMSLHERAEHEQSMIMKALKRKILSVAAGDADSTPIKRRKGPSGPNPLSCKKKKSKSPSSSSSAAAAAASRLSAGDGIDGRADGEGQAKAAATAAKKKTKKRRQKKKTNQAGDGQD